MIFKVDFVSGYLCGCKGLLMVKSLALSAALFSTMGMANSLGFDPSYAQEGVPVRFSWNMFSGGVMGRWTGCNVTGLPGVSPTGTSGALTINPVSSLNANVSCFKYDPLSQRVIDSSSIAYKFDIEPTITIDYPDGVYTDDGWPMKLTYKNASSCSYRLVFQSPVQPTPYTPFNSPFSQRIAFGNIGSQYQVYIEVKCINDSGRENIQQKRVLVIPKPADTTVPKIRNFSHGDIVFGRTGLSWSTEYVSSCTMTGKGITANVSTQGFNYKVDVPIGTTTFTLTCKKDSSNTVSKSLDVKRAQESGVGPCTDCVGGIPQNELQSNEFISPEGVLDKKILKQIERKIVSVNDLGDSVLLELNKISNTLDIYVWNSESGSYDFSHRTVNVFEFDEVDFIEFDEISRAVRIITK